MQQITATLKRKLPIDEPFRKIRLEVVNQNQTAYIDYYGKHIDIPKMFSIGQELEFMFLVSGILTEKGCSHFLRGIAINEIEVKDHITVKP